MFSSVEHNKSPRKKKKRKKSCKILKVFPFVCSWRHAECKIWKLCNFSFQIQIVIVSVFSIFHCFWFFFLFSFFLLTLQNTEHIEKINCWVYFRFASGGKETKSKKKKQSLITDCFILFMFLFIFLYFIRCVGEWCLNSE